MLATPGIDEDDHADDRRLWRLRQPHALAAMLADARDRGCERICSLGDLGGFGAECNAPAMATGRPVRSSP